MFNPTECKHYVNYDGPEPACEKCGLIFDVDFINDWDETLVRYHDCYNPGEYFKKKVDKLSGVNPEHKGVRDVIRHFMVPGKYSWSEIWKMIKKTGGEDWFLDIPRYMGHCVELPTEVQQFAFNLTQLEGLKIKDLYIYYKMYQMWDWDYMWIPLKTSLQTLKKYDEVWKNVCKDFDLKFIKSKTWKVVVT